MHFISKCSVLTLGYLHERDATIMLCFLAHTRQKWYTIYKHSKEEKDFLITRIQQSGSTSNKTCMKMFVCKKLQHEEKESDKGELSKRCIGYVSSKEWDHNRKNNFKLFSNITGVWQSTTSFDKAFHSFTAGWKKYFWYFSVLHI